MGDNLRIDELRKDIVKVLNDSKLPIEVIRLLLKDMLSEITPIAQATIEKERAKESENE